MSILAQREYVEETLEPQSAQAEPAQSAKVKPLKIQATVLEPPPLPEMPLALRPFFFFALPYTITWVNSMVYHQALKNSPKHPLVRLQNTGIELREAVAACAGFHHQSGPGPPATYSIETFVRAEIVRVWARTCSDPALEELLRNNLIVRWFCGLPLDTSTPDHATLARFHAWTTDNAPDAFFNATLKFLDEVDPEDPRTTPQIIDTFAMETPAQRRKLNQMLRNIGTKIVEICREQLAQGEELPVSETDQAAVNKRHHNFNPTQRAAAFALLAPACENIYNVCLPLLGKLKDNKGKAKLKLYLGYLRKVLNDETTTDQTGKIVERKTGEKGEYRLGSTVDPEATFRNHGSGVAILGYNAMISTTATRIRSAVVKTGCTSDSLAPVELLKQETANGQPLPETVTMDMAGGWGRTRYLVAKISNWMTTMVAYIPLGGGLDPTRFGPADFKVSADGLSCICPNGVVSTLGHKAGEDGGITFLYKLEQCRECPLWDKCRKPSKGKGKGTSKGERRVYISPYQRYLEEGAQFNETEKGKTLLKGRWGVEAVISWLVRYDGARRSRRVGQKAAQYQLNQACACRNLWRWLERGAPGAPNQPNRRN